MKNFRKCETCGSHGHGGRACPVYRLNQQQERRRAQRRRDLSFGLTPELEREIILIRKAWKIAAALGSILVCATSLFAGTITGRLQTATGGAVTNGTLSFRLSQSAVLVGSASLVTSPASCYISAAGNIVGVPDPLVAPVVTANTISGTLPAGTYFVVVTYAGGSGESVASPESTVVLSAQGTVIVSAPVKQPSNATGYNVYIGTTSGGETLQASVTGFTQYSQASALGSGAALPASNSSVCSLAFSDQLVPSGTYYSVNLVNKNGSTIAGFPQTWCTYGGQAGVINVSNGAPTGNCGTNGVFYPTPIMANPANNAPQSISSPMTFIGNLTLQGTVLAGNVSVSSINNILYVGGTLYPTIGAALAACPSLGCDIYVPSGTYVEPGYTVGTLLGTKPVTIFLGSNAVTQPTSQITLESSGRIVGGSRQGSAIRADSTFPTSTALVRIGSSVAVDGSRLEHLQVDCSNIAGCTGVFSAFAQEESGLRDVLVHNITGGGIGIDWETNGANNSFMEDVEVLGAVNNSTSTIGIKVNDVKGFRGINGVTVNFTGSPTLPAQCIRLDNATTGVFNSIHMEGCARGIEVGQSTGVQGVVISQVFPSNTTTDIIKIDGPDTPPNNVVIMGILKGAATNAITDVENSKTITDSDVPFYIAALGQTSYISGALQLNGNPVRTTIGSGTSTSNGTAIGSGVSQAQPAITISGATTGDVATCSLNAAPPATWQTGIQFLLPVVTSNTVTPWLSNPTAGSITPVAAVIRCSVSR